MPRRSHTEEQIPAGASAGGARREGRPWAQPAQPSVGPVPMPIYTWGVPEGWSFQQVLMQNPKLNAQLQANPNLLCDLNWRRSHPQFNDYMSAKPNV